MHPRMIPPLVVLALLLLGAGTACGSGGSSAKIALSGPVDGTYRLVILNGDGSGTPTVAPDPGGVDFPTWSPDGSKIAFHDVDSVSTYISVVRADGSHYVRVFDNQNSGVHYTWSGRSDAIAYDWADVIHIVRADGTGRHKLTDGDFPSWSPDGRMVAFIRGAYLHVINSDGTADRRLTRLDTAADTPAEQCFTILWSSDSRKVACSTSTWKAPVKTICESAGDCGYVDPGLNTTLCQVHIVDVRRRSLVHVVGGLLNGAAYRQCDIAWSPDGRRIAFTRKGVIYTVTADGRHERRFVHGLTPSWSPDGGHLAFIRNGAFHVLDLARHVERRVARTDDIAWSPDGKFVAFTRTISEQVQGNDGSFTPGVYAVEKMDVANGKVQRIWPPNHGTCEACGQAVWQPR